jgi:DNA repair exonuclease SbcCD ATPase subunit
MIKKIYHIADVHCRNYKRHDEYNAVFKKLFAYLKKSINQKNKDSLIYLAGDIVHSKNDMSPELIQIVSSFLKSCADIAPTVLITGNHDANLNNDSRLDALTPIVKALNHSNLMYYKDSGLYKFENITFSVFSVFGKTDAWITADEIENDDTIKIALHHGAVSSAITDLNYSISNDHVTPKIFKGFDLALLGDIHRTQFLDLNNTVAYAGSLIQQDHGEGLTHGLLVWDLEGKKSEFVEIKNDTAYATIEINQGEIITPEEYLQQLPKNLRLRIKYSDCNYPDVLGIIQNLKRKHKLIETSIVKLNDVDYDKNSSNAILGDVRDVEYQNTLITEWVQEMAPQVNTDEIRHINRVMNSKLETNNQIVRNVIWKPVQFEFSNMFSYGPNNFIDFNDFNGIQGLFAPNASGKSTLLDAVTFCLFDKCSRTYRAIDVLNNKKTSFKCKLTFELNNELYSIERIGTKHQRTGKVKVDVNFMKLSTEENLNGEDRDDTNKIIRGHIGSYDDFLLTALSTQNDNKNFIFKSQRERKDLLNSFLDISIFDSLYQVTKDEIKEKQGQFKALNSELLNSSDNNYIELIASLRNKISETNVLYENTEESLTEISESIKRITSEIKTIDEYIDIEQVEKLIEKTQNEVYEFEQQKEKSIEKWVELKEQKHKLSEELSEFNADEILSQKEEISELSKTIQSITSQIAKYSSELQSKQKQKEHLDSHEYDPNCKYCMNNPFVIEATEALTQIPIISQQITDLKNRKESHTLDLTSKEEAFSLKRTTYTRIKAELSECESALSKHEYSIKNANDNIRNKFNLHNLYLEKRDTYYEQEQTQKQNKRLQAEIAQLETEQTSLKAKLKDLSNELMNLNGKLTTVELKNSEYIQKQEQVHKLHNELQAYETYQDAVSKNGVPYRLLTKIIPVIEDESNLILNQIVDFHITLETDQKNINCYIHYNEESSWPVELASGMERFMISIAIRAALINVSSLPRPNFIAIDEGFGVADSNTISLLPALFDYLKQQFEFIIIISHLDSIRDFADSFIEISKINGLSKIGR